MASIDNELKDLIQGYISEVREKSEKIHYRSPRHDSAKLCIGRFLLDTPRLQEIAKEQAKGKSKRQPAPKIPKPPWKWLEGSQQYVNFDGDGPSLHIVEYLSSTEWVKHRVLITRNDIDADRIEFTGLRTDLKSWQKIAVVKLLEACNSPLEGAILGDDTGLGKSLSALLAALAKRKEMFPYAGPVLVVCRAGCVIQWLEEIYTHFNKAHRPRVLIVDTPDVSPRYLVTYDVLICSNGFLKRRYSEVLQAELFSSVAYGVNIDVAKRCFPKYIHKRKPQPLHSGLYRYLNQQFSVLILDEAHDARDPDSLLYAAVQSLDYLHAFLLTATPLYNSWNDIGGILTLLPGSPLMSFEHFRHIFPLPPLEDEAEVGRKGPEEPILSLLIHLIQGSVLARPKAVLGLKQFRQHVIRVETEVPRGKDRYQPKHPARDSQVKSGLQKLRRAQQMANHEALYNPDTPYEQGKLERRAAFDEIRNEAKFKIRSWLKGEKNNSLKLGGEVESQEGPMNGGILVTDEAGGDKTDLIMDRSLEDLSIDEYNEFKRWYRKPAPVPAQDGDNVATDTTHVETEPSLAQNRQREATNKELDAAQKSMYDDEGFDYYQDEEDLDFQPHRGQGARETQGDEQEDDGDDDDDVEVKKLSIAEAIKNWKENVKAMSTEELESPKTTTILASIVDLRSKHPGEKIIVTSSSIKFLDIIQELLSRHLPGVKVTEFNGRIVSVEERVRIANDFNMTGKGSYILLLSASCGGTGLNLYGGSRLIITEQFWTPGLEKQVIGRAHRMPQTKQVHVYHVRMNTDLDMLIRSLVEKKTSCVDPLDRAIRRGDLDDYVLPPLPNEETQEFDLHSDNEGVEESSPRSGSELPEGEEGESEEGERGESDEETAENDTSDSEDYRWNSSTMDGDMRQCELNRKAAKKEFKNWYIS
ncbi:hypothetical protein AU210_000860 [Fusarium oxysporum f. sp. radicis-cucumerinum]|uniref:Uncharacterized protein n=1 Tax=Fusarium oxysporum f. sp. radicis-cucumerinum TaxID=327505 RepID=A0A2H3HUI5_FUSOX|nr:hypothetical protein AU210_000860 [Fusarium oxysporum f. sp. radicis-cucumerinum]